MASQSFNLCRTCGQRKDITHFGLKQSGFGRQEVCHDCVLELLRKSGKVDSYTHNDPKPERTRSAAMKDTLYWKTKIAIREKRVNAARKSFYINKKSASVQRFNEMFPESN